MRSISGKRLRTTDLRAAWREIEAPRSWQVLEGERAEGGGGGSGKAAEKFNARNRQREI